MPNNYFYLVPKRLARVFATSLFVLIGLLTTSNALASEPTSVADLSATPDLSCGGSVHAEAIGLWEHVLRDYFNKQISHDLKQIGDTYVLYNAQEYLYPFVEMTRRCKDRPQIAELVDTLSPAFTSLQPLPSAPNMRGWICRGGNICNQANRLINTEVQLNSAQFLGLIGALSTTIVEAIPTNQQTSAERAFVSQTTDAIASHLNRWLSPAYFTNVNARAKMSPHEANGEAAYFSDKDLWFITALSDLAELHQANIPLSKNGELELKSLQAKNMGIAQIIDLFLSRTFLVNTPNGPRAELDRGYWRNDADMRYALYNGIQSPVKCSKDSRGVEKKLYQVQGESSFIDPNVGWDISHARRLVPALETLSRNMKNLASVFDYRNTNLDPAKLTSAFSNQMTDVIWNQDTNHPLFSNFWDGSNGWYRVGYENGTGCNAGEPPYSLTDSFPTGGYPMWSQGNTRIRGIDIRLYQLTHSNDASSIAFVKKYYPSLSRSEDTDSPIKRDWQNTSMFAFIPSLISQ